MTVRHPSGSGVSGSVSVTVINRHDVKARKRYAVNMAVAQQRHGIATMVVELVTIFGPRHKQHLERYAPREEPVPPA